MQWGDIWKIVLCAIASVGGVGGIIVLSIKFSANIIAERLQIKYENKMQKELEKYKSGLDNKIYISKSKFDTEFTLYRELTKSFFEVVRDITIMIPAGLAKYPSDEEEKKKYENTLYKQACQSAIVAQDTLKSNIPFIREEFYIKYEEILSLCKLQLDVFEQRWDELYLVSQKEKETFSLDDYRRSIEIKDKFKVLNKELRDYLDKIDILE